MKIKRKLIALLCFLLLLNTRGFARLVYNSDGSVYVSIPQLDLTDDLKFSDYTTTRYAPWWVNYHITTPNQIQEGFKGGDCGQLTFAMEYSPVNPDRMLWGTDCSNIYYSEDGGESWKIGAEGLVMAGIADIVFDPYDEMVAYAASMPVKNGAVPLSSQYIGMWKTTDGGKSWRLLTSETRFDIQYGHQNILAFSEVNNVKTLFAATLDGIYKTSDEGVTWQRAGLSGKVINGLAVDGSSIYAATEDSGVMKSSDAGATWAGLNTGITDTCIKDIQIHPGTGSQMVCVSEKQLYYTYDSGASWSKGYSLAASSIVKLNRIGFGACGASGSARLYVTLNYSGYPMRYSTDMGRSLNRMYFITNCLRDETMTGYFGSGFAVHPTDPMTVVWAGYKSTDGGLTYAPITSGFSGIRAINFTFNPNDSNDVIISAVDVGTFRTYDYGRDDEEYPPFLYTMYDRAVPCANGKLAYSTAIDPSNSDIVLTNIRQYFYRSTDGGVNYTAVKSDCTPSKLLKYHNECNGIIYHGFHTSYDGGATFINNPMELVAVSPIDNDIVYGCDSGYLYKSTDCGRTFTRLCETSFASSGIQRVQADLTIPDRLYIGTYVSGLYVINNGVSSKYGEERGFVKSAGGILTVFDVSQNPLNPNHLVAGGSDNYHNTVTAGLFESFDRGESWHVVPGLLGIKDIAAVEFHPTLPRVYVGTSCGTFVYEYDKLLGSSFKVVEAGFCGGDGRRLTQLCGADSVTFAATVVSLYDGVSKYYAKITYYDSDRNVIHTEYKPCFVKGCGIYSLKAALDPEYLDCGCAEAEIVRKSGAMSPIMSAFDFKSGG